MSPANALVIIVMTMFSGCILGITFVKSQPLVSGFAGVVIGFLVGAAICIYLARPPKPKGR